jgi:hypothetical protein
LAAVWMGRVGPVREGEGELMTRREDIAPHTAPTHTTNTHHAARTSGLGERGWEIERARGGEKKRTGLMAGRRGVWKLTEKRGTGGTSDDKRRRAD